MKKMYPYFLTFLVMLTGCTDPAEEPADAVSSTPVHETAEAQSPPAVAAGCYIRVMERDTLAASLQQSGDLVTGTLTFDNYQKDGSTGSVKGRLENGILKLLYSFTSEGMNSVMEIRFKVKNGTLHRGIGDIIPRGDTVYYSNPVAITYEENGLQKIDCAQLPSKYK